MTATLILLLVAAALSLPWALARLKEACTRDFLCKVIARRTSELEPEDAVRLLSDTIRSLPAASGPPIHREITQGVQQGLLKVTGGDRVPTSGSPPQTTCASETALPHEYRGIRL